MTVEDQLGLAVAASPLDARARARLAIFATRLLERNATTNLTAARDLASVGEHVRDALTIAADVVEPLVDVGSGGGFPGIPLAIATGFRTTLVEAVAKKAAFLREIAALLELPIVVVAARAEDVGRDGAFRGTFASATARAVSSLPTVLELTMPLLAVGGLAVLQRGGISPAERIAASDAALVLGARLESERPAVRGDAGWGGDGPPDAGRRVFFVRKIAPTGPRFPRRAGIPAKRPLCVATVTADR